MTFENDLLADALALPGDAISYELGRRFADLHPDSEIVEGSDWDFRIQKYADAGHCGLAPDGSLHTQVVVSFDSDEGVVRSIENGAFDVRWRGREFKLLLASFRRGGCPEAHYWIAGETRAAAESFFAAVCAWNDEVRDEVLVFQSGYWSKDQDLFAAVRGASFDDLILDDGLKTQLRGDLRRFLDAKETYERLGIPWKRGMVLVGPPGNGKTHTIKALVNETGLPCLYVKSFISQDSTDHDGMRDIFSRAREKAPCVLVLEDLDSLVNDGNRSYFLNELDGFADNAGIVTIATTNHPDKLDPAIVDRPSRFDRKYHFPLPTRGLRERYLERWSRKLAAEAALAPAEVAALADRTEGFSFAYLKELIASALLSWAGSPESGKFFATAVDVVELLRSQMRTPVASDG